MNFLPGFEPVPELHLSGRERSQRGLCLFAGCESAPIESVEVAGECLKACERHAKMWRKQDEAFKTQHTRSE